MVHQACRNRCVAANFLRARDPLLEVGREPRWVDLLANGCRQRAKRLALRFDQFGHDLFHEVVVHDCLLYNI